MLDIHANMLFVASRIGTPARSAAMPVSSARSGIRVNHKLDHVRLVSPDKKR